MSLPLPKLDPAMDMPLYLQLYEYFRTSIQSGRLGAGDRLPATRELAGLLGLNRTTVAAAYELLEANGLITGQVGRGSFVTAQQAAGSHVNWTALLGESEPPPLGIAESVISFATSRPSEGLFPLENFRETCAEVLASPGASAILQLGSPGGYAPLRQYLLEQTRQEGLLLSNNDLVITSGCQQALDLIQRVLIQPGDKAAIEDPVYPGLKNLLSRAGAKLLGVPVGREGIELEALERVLAKERPKLLVITSNFQNPTGATLSLAARKAVLRMVRDSGTVLVENDTYGQLRYEGGPLPLLKQLDESGDTIVLRTFSKIAFPGLRVGWVVGPRPLIARLIEAKQLADLHTDQLSQAVLLRFAQSGRLDSHHTRIVEAGAKCLAAALSACEQHLPAGTHFTRPQGGMNLWVRLPEPLDAAELLPRAQREGVTYLPGKYFAVSRSQPGGLRLSFAGLDPQRIGIGIAILGKVFASELERAKAARAFDPAPAMV